MKYFYFFSFACITMLFTGCGWQLELRRDSDDDGIANVNDKCPDTKGLAEFFGCPDIDVDGIPDKDDQCPEVAGPVENNGCPWPDTDGDGIIDRDDYCPNVPGPPENAGCPWPDSDGDGILDKDDQCPDVAGPVESNGCPKPSGVWTDGWGTLYLREFPIKPPRPSDVETLPAAYFQDSKTLEAINRRLIRALEHNNYNRISYYYVKDGFAMVTQLEQTDAQGKPLHEDIRWSREIKMMDSFSLANYFSALFKAKPGFYRCIVFIVNKTPISFSNTAVSSQTMDMMMDAGATSLPEEIGSQVVSPKHKITALIYQFKKPESSDNAKLLLPTPIPGKHLTAAGIKKSLKP